MELLAGVLLPMFTGVLLMSFGAIMIVLSPDDPITKKSDSALSSEPLEE